MFRKAILLRRPRRIKLLKTTFVILALLAFSPLLLGLLLMSIEEFLTGRSVGENNSAFGVLPWLTLYTLAIFGSIFLLLLKLTLIVLVHDAIALFRKS